MAKSPPNYFSCAKCGWRGVLSGNATHECKPDRRASAAIPNTTTDRKLPARQVAEHAPSSDDEATVRMSTLHRILEEVSRLLGRRIEVSLDENWRLDVKQRCGVCRDEITKAILWPGLDKLQLELAKAIRSSYLLHNCKPVEQSLIGVTYDDLEELSQAVERELLELTDRLVEIRRIMKERR